MRRQVDYDVVYAADDDLLRAIGQVITHTKKMVDEGWQALGGIAFADNGRRIAVSQAIVKYGEETK